MFVLDSDILSLMLWKGATASILEARMAKVPNGELVSTIVNYEEQLGGWIDSIRQKDKMSDLIECYRRLHQQLNLYRNVPLLDFDETAAIRFQELRKKHRRIKRSDLKIAAIAITNHATLVTRNLSDFKQIPGLKVEDWTKE
ncbi:MAG: type II toxin-antitoxin system VapC family toxin [Gemmataceae bacterium]|nr:type II toxin-antitoxin system VapC family toxin [Gemmataceae bacterium]